MNSKTNNEHSRLFATCVATLKLPDQVQFIASYFNTTTSHAIWLLDHFKRNNDPDFMVFSSELDQ